MKNIEILVKISTVIDDKKITVEETMQEVIDDLTDAGWDAEIVEK